MIEKELKYLLRKKDFDSFASYMNINGKLIEQAIQKNYYFDTKDFLLKNHRMTVRIRVKGEDNCEFTIKRKIRSDIDNCKIKLEKNKDLSISQVKEIILQGKLHDFAHLFEEFKSEFHDSFLSEDVGLLGCLETNRNTYELDGEDGIICVDESHYLDYDDYEIEWETENIDRAKVQIEEIFRKLEIEPLPIGNSKSSRFIKRYASINLI